MTPSFVIRPVRRDDYEQWRPLWDGYNSFYGRSGPTALPESITATTWERFFSDSEPVHALVAASGEELIGLVHYLFHRSTTRLREVCYLQDLYTKQAARGRGAGRQLIHAVYEAARQMGSSRVYWLTQASNSAARTLYDQVAEHSGLIVYIHEL